MASVRPFLVCTCGVSVSLDECLAGRIECPARRTEPSFVHVLSPPESTEKPQLAESQNPFLRFREFLWVYKLAREIGLSDDQYVSVVNQIDDQLAQTGNGKRFETTPLLSHHKLAGASGPVYVKDETNQVSGCFKARHVMGIAIYLALLEAKNGNSIDSNLAIASCGNAALAAATIAAASSRTLDAYVPEDVSPVVQGKLQQLGATVHLCERKPGVSGDPCYNEFTEAVAQGGLPFCCQGPDNAWCIDGGQTMAWEICLQVAAEQEQPVASIDRAFFQTGGGALLSANIQGFQVAVKAGLLKRMPRIHCVQTNGCAPLQRAYNKVVALIAERLGDTDGLSKEQMADLMVEHPEVVEECLMEARKNEGGFMWAWEETPHSIAHGVLDDETYDWYMIVKGMLVTGGYPLTVDDQDVIKAYDLGHNTLNLNVCHTGACGFGGLLKQAESGALAAGGSNVCVFTGQVRE